MNSIIQNHHWLVFDEATNPDRADINSALSYQDAFLRYLPLANDQVDQPQAILHFYPLSYKAVLLGSKDVRLKDLAHANQYLTDQGYQLTVRPHGGLAVVNDPGILNFGLVTDKRTAPLTIDAAYELFVEVIQASLTVQGLTVESYEIADSYCPGKYDLVVDGRKIGGIAQRRFQDGVATAAYISVNGDQDQRGQLIQTYYRIGEATADFPLVNPNSMTTLAELTGKPLTVANYQAHLLNLFEAHTTLTKGDYLSGNLQHYYRLAQDKAADRLKKITF